MRFPHKMYDKMVAQERAEQQAIEPEVKKEETKKEESVFDDPEKEVIREVDQVADQESEGGDPDESESRV